MKQLWVLFVVLAAGCSPGSTKTAAPSDDLLTVRDVMRTRIEPAAQLFWHSSGSVDTERGSQSLLPTTPQGWKAAGDAIDDVIEGGRLLKARQRARDQEQWIKRADDLIVVARQAKGAVKRRDGDQMFITGGDLYAACTACHKQYLLPLLGPDGRPKKIDANGSPIITPPETGSVARPRQ